MHQIIFRLGHCATVPQTPLVSLQRSPYPLVWFMGPKRDGKGPTSTSLRIYAHIGTLASGIRSILHFVRHCTWYCATSTHYTNIDWCRGQNWKILPRSYV